MPGLRYGPDITDDAAMLVGEERKLRARLKSAQNPSAQTAVRNRLKAIDSVTKDIFGTRTSRNRLSQYSVAQQGYAPTGRRGGGRGIRRSPAGRADQVPNRSGYKARPAIAESDRGIYASSKKRAKSGQVSDALKAAQKASKSKSDKERRASAKKAAQAKVKGATRPKKRT